MCSSDLERMWATVEHFGEAIAGDAKGEAPVKTGALRDSIGVKFKKSALSAMVVVDAPHGGIVHNGTSSGPNHPFSTRANPFVRRAAEKNVGNVRGAED